MGMGIFSTKRGVAEAAQSKVKKPAQEQREASGGDAERDFTVISARAEIKDAVLVVPEEDVEIRGRWTGNGRIVCNTLIVALGATVEGVVLAKRMKISGKVRGEISAGMLMLTETGDIEGTLKCRQMSTQPKARMRATITCDVAEAIGDLPATNETVDAIPDSAGTRRRIA